jgi:hypothetical protein
MRMISGQIKDITKEQKRDYELEAKEAFYNA